MGLVPDNYLPFCFSRQCHLKGYYSCSSLLLVYIRASVTQATQGAISGFQNGRSGDACANFKYSGEINAATYFTQSRVIRSWRLARQPAGEDGQNYIIAAP